MKTQCTILLALLALVFTAHGQIVIPGTDDSDGALVITADTTIDLSLATPGDGVTVKWDSDNTANSGNGIYDPLKWAVVFKYSSVNIAPGVTVSFANHPSRAPVVWLVSGDVVIDGILSLNGQGSQTAPRLAEGGPGGSRGGTGYFSVGVGDGAGFGPGGGQRQAQGGLYGSGGAAYGNPSLVPLGGGSGGSGAARNNPTGGAGGGGAILIACAGTVTVNGTVRANGGTGPQYYFSDRAGGGSGGGIRLVAADLNGGGNIQALGGLGGRNLAAGVGRIRIERVATDGAAVIAPDPSVVSLAPGSTALLWPPSDAPTVKIISIGGTAAPDDPRAEFGGAGADVALPETATVQVVIETAHVEQASQVKVRLTPRASTNYQEVDAVFDSELSPTEPILRWTADIPVGNGYAAVQARVIRP